MPPLRGSASLTTWPEWLDNSVASVCSTGGDQLAALSRPAACAYHGYCATGGCHISAKNSTAVTTIPAAVQTKKLTIFDRAMSRES